MKPRPALAWAIGLLYPPIFIGLLLASGVGYDQIGDSTANLIRAIVIPLAVLTVALIVLTTWLGWWRQVLWDERPAPRWLIALPILWVLTILIGLDYERIGLLDPAFLLWAAIGTLGIGFCEETVYRGLTVVGFRSSWSEVRVWLFSSLLFGLLHAWNVFAGHGVGPTATQVVITFLMGSVLYACRRATGTILIPVILHAAWDWMAFTGGSNAFAEPTNLLEPSASPATLGLFVMIVVFAIGARWLLRTPAPTPSQS